MVSAQRPRIGVVRETVPGERRVALVPKVITQLIGKGLDVVVESGAGEAALSRIVHSKLPALLSETPGTATLSSR